MKTGASLAARPKPKELQPRRSASNTSALVEIVMSKTLCRAPTPRPEPGFGVSNEFFTRSTGPRYVRPRIPGAPIMPVSGERRQNASVHPYLVMLPAQRSRKETAQPTHPDPRKPITQRPVNRSSACVSVAHTASPSHIICRARAEVRLRYRA